MRDGWEPVTPGDQPRAGRLVPRHSSRVGPWRHRGKLSGSAPRPRRSSRRCRHWPCAPPRSTSGRASPTSTAPSSCWPRPPSMRSTTGATSTRPAPACPNCAGRSPSTAAGATASTTTPTPRCWSPPAPPRPSPPRCWRSCDPGDEVVALRAVLRLVRRLDRPGRRRPRPRRAAAAGLPSRPRRLRPPIGAAHQLLLLNSPHNPTGMVLSADELAEIARLAVEHDVVVVTDEVYEHLVYDARAPPAGHVPRHAGAHDPDLVGGQDVLGDRLEDRLGVRRRPIWSRRSRTVKQFLTYVSGGAVPARGRPRAWTRPTSWSPRCGASCSGRRDLLSAGLAAVGFEPCDPAAARTS